MNPKKHASLFFRNIEEIIPEENRQIFFQKAKPLRIKWGADPSAPDLHLGHMVILKKLRLLQQMGHEILFLIGDFTAMIGDPTGRSETRKPLSGKDVQKNAKTYQEQIFKFLDPHKTKIVFNSEWLNTLTSHDFITLAAKYPLARMLEREDFSKRFKEGHSISLHELLYPLLQGYDSVALKADVEIGGTDQKFNLLMGRHLQKEYGQPQQVILTLPILEGLDGKQKMSKSLGNHIGILESPKEMFGKLMSIPDTLITRYYTLLTDVSGGKIEELEDLLRKKIVNPKSVKEQLAGSIVSELHSQEEASQALEEFHRIFSKKELPEDIPVLSISMDVGESILIGDLLTRHHVLDSKRECVRLIEQGAITVDGERIENPYYTFVPQEGQVLKIGKRRFFKLRLKHG